MNEEAISTCLTSTLFGGSLCGVVSIDNFAPRKDHRKVGIVMYSTRT